jgi:hypothetical protein
MVHSKLPLLALASTALAGVVQREESEVEVLNPGESHFTSAPAWAASTPVPTEKGSSASVPFPDELSDQPQGPHSTFFPSAPSIHFPLPTDGPPPFVTPLPGKGEFAHTEDFVRPTAIPQEYNDPEPPHSISPQGFSDPVQSRPSEIYTPPPAFSSEGSVTLYSSLVQPPIQSAHLEPSQALSSQPQPPLCSSARPSEPSGGIHPVEPSGHPERPHWFYGLPHPFNLFPGEPEKPHEGIPLLQPSGSIPGEPPKPQGGPPTESHGFPPPPPPDYEHDPVPVAGAHPTEPAVNVGGPSPHYGIVPPVSCPYSTPGEHPSRPSPYPIPDEKPTPHDEDHLPPPVVQPTGYGKGWHDQVPPPPHGVPGSEEPSPAQPTEYPAHPSQPGPAVTEPATTNLEAELPSMSFYLPRVEKSV